MDMSSLSSEGRQECCPLQPYLSPPFFDLFFSDLPSFSEIAEFLMPRILTSSLAPQAYTEVALGSVLPLVPVDVSYI